MMTRRWIAWGLAAALLTSCTSYDRELLGDPEPRSAAADPEEWNVAEEPAADAPEDSLDMFADLRFYGSWYDLYPYGWVWRPVVVSDWAPMTHGHWVWTSYGWMWVSYDPFGWATYNYGYWTYDFALGWVWLPSYAWEPVRCQWVVYDDWICWSPLPPPGVRYKDPWMRGDLDPWVSVPAEKFKDTEVARYRTTPKFKSGHSERTLRRDAPDAGSIERRTGRSLRSIDVTIDKTTFGGRELTRVVLPPEQQQIIEQRRAEIQTRYKGAPPAPLSPPRADDGATRGTPPPKSKPASSRKESPRKFKEKEKDSSSEKSKSGEDAKKDDKKDDKKDKGR